MIRTLADSEYGDLLRLSELTTDEIRALWDEYDGTNCPSGISGEMIHHALNARGRGNYCIV